MDNLSLRGSRPKLPARAAGIGWEGVFALGATPVISGDIVKAALAVVGIGAASRRRA